MEIDEFDDLDEEEARAMLLTCAAVPAWADHLVAGRPYAEVGLLLARADELASSWSEPEVDAALADHPRIGERHAGAGTSAELSTREQSGVDPEDVEVRVRLADGNRAYEARFDRIFLVRAAGRSATDILDQLEQRLTHDPETEVGVVAGQLREIAALRLRGLFA